MQYLPVTGSADCARLLIAEATTMGLQPPCDVQDEYTPTAFAGLYKEDGQAEDRATTLERRYRRPDSAAAAAADEVKAPPSGSDSMATR